MVKKGLSPRSGSVALRQLSPKHETGPLSFLLSFFFLPIHHQITAKLIMAMGIIIVFSPLCIHPAQETLAKVSSLVYITLLLIALIFLNMYSVFFL